MNTVEILEIEPPLPHATAPLYTRNIVGDHTHKIHIQVTKGLKLFISTYPQMSESSSYTVRAAPSPATPYS